MPHHTVAIVGNTLCIKADEPSFFTPEMMSVYWPCHCFSEIDREFYEKLVGKEAITQRFNGGVFEVNTGVGFSGFWYKMTLRDGEKTLPIKTDVTPIPCPKVRKGIEVEYRNGLWMKCLRTGWTAA